MALSSETQALARAIKLERGTPGLPVVAVTVFLHAVEPMPKQAKRLRAQELLALAIRINREIAERAGELVAQLFFVAGLVLGDMARAEDMFAKAGLGDAKQKLVGMPGFDARNFELRDQGKQTGFLNFLTKKNR